MGVGPPGHTGRDQLATIEETLFPTGAGSRKYRAIVVCCAQAPSSHLEALQAAGARLHKVPCVGNLHTSVVELLVRGGAPGVLIGGCPPRDCIGREGPKWLNERLFNDREAELQPRVDRRRVRTTTLAPGDLAATIAAFERFARDLASLSPQRAEANPEVETICDPVPLEEVAS
jgi:coenzyme F420-reducing hydrogenase delta subunit